MRAKLFLLITGLIFTLGMLTACGGDTITDAKSLVAANKTAQEAAENFHMDSNVDMDMSMNMDGLEAILGTSAISMPMEVEMSMDMSKESAHGNTKTSISMLGQSQNVDAEMYCDIKNGIVYSKAAGSDSWVKSEQDINTTDMMDSLSGMADEILEKAEFSSDDASYKMTLSADALGESIKDLGLINDLSSSGINITNLKISEGSIVYTFDKDTVLLKDVDMKDVKMEATGSMQGTTVNVNVDMDAKYEFSKYGELDPKDYEIPDEVTKATDASKTESTQATDATQPATKATEGQQTLPKAETQLTVSGGGTPNGQGWYVVGQDSIPAGTYKIFHGDGQGYLSIKNANHSKTMGEWSIGYIDKSKELEDGTEVTLVAGDLVFITKDLNVVFDPVN